MNESPVRQLKEISRQSCDAVVSEFVKALRSLEALEGFSLNEQAQAVEHIGRRLRDECCGDELRGHAVFANHILTIGTTRLA